MSLDGQLRRPVRSPRHCTVVSTPTDAKRSPSGRPGQGPHVSGALLPAIGVRLRRRPTRASSSYQRRPCSRQLVTSSELDDLFPLQRQFRARSRPEPLPRCGCPRCRPPRPHWRRRTSPPTGRGPPAHGRRAKQETLPPGTGRPGLSVNRSDSVCTHRPEPPRERTHGAVCSPSRRLCASRRRLVTFLAASAWLRPRRTRSPYPPMHKKD